MSVHSRLMKISNVDALPGMVMDGPDTVALGQHGPELPPPTRMERLKAFSLRNRNPLVGTAIGVGGLGAGLGLGALLRNPSSQQY